MFCILHNSNQHKIWRNSVHIKINWRFRWWWCVTLTPVFWRMQGHQTFRASLSCTQVLASLGYMRVCLKRNWRSMRRKRRKWKRRGERRRGRKTRKGRKGEEEGRERRWRGESGNSSITLNSILRKCNLRTGWDSREESIVFILP